MHSWGVVVHRRPCSDSPKTREMRNERAATTGYTGKAHRGCCHGRACPVTEVSRCVSAPGEELKRHALLPAAGRMLYYYTFSALWLKLCTISRSVVRAFVHFEPHSRAPLRLYLMGSRPASV